MNPQEIKDWHPADIKAALAKKNLTLRDVARKYGLPEQICSDALSGRSRLGEEIIAKELGLTPKKLWPSRFERKRYAVRSKTKPMECSLSLSKMKKVS